MPDGLLDEVKDYLNITWVDVRTENNITGMIKRGMSYLQKVAGVTSLDFTLDDTPKALLLDYVRYANSQALELFETNFRGELLFLNLEYQAKGVDLDEN